ncbi:MAG TPA: acylphosphatase [Synergistetes bacterium]|nr:acylphosphatase [Synergistota bacterium]
MKDGFCKRVEISGIVQGVGFRWQTRQLAVRLGICGWIKNRPDGIVEAVFQGTDVLVQGILEWCANGPSGATVTDLRLFECVYDPDILDFVIISDR